MIQGNETGHSFTFSASRVSLWLDSNIPQSANYSYVVYPWISQSDLENGWNHKS